MSRIDKYLGESNLNEVKVHRKGFKNNPKEELLYGMNQGEYVKFVRDKLMDKQGNNPGKGTYNNNYVAAKKATEEMIETNKKYALKKMDAMLPDIIQAWLNDEIY